MEQGLCTHAEVETCHAGISVTVMFISETGFQSDVLNDINISSALL